MEQDKFIVAVRGADGSAGVGFVIDEWHVMTCAHVVNVALDRHERSQPQPGHNDEIQLEFPLLGSRLELGAKVVQWNPPARSADRIVNGLSDIAVLRLNARVPGDVVMPGLSTREPPAGVKIFGYPSDIPRPRGGWVSCRATGFVGGGLLQLDAPRDGALRPQPGYSGSPVVDESGRAMGMLAEASIRGNQYDCYAIPAKWLGQAWPDLSSQGPVPADAPESETAPPDIPASDAASPDDPLLTVRGLVGRGKARSVGYVRTHKRLVIVISFVLVLFVLGTVLVRGFSWGKSDPPAGFVAVPCGVTVHMSASVDKDQLLGKMAEEYNGSHCSKVVVTGKVSGEAAQALSRGWDEALDGPLPDVWSPSSSVWASVVESREKPKANAVDMPRDRPSMARTPVVIAMPKPMAEALGWPNADLGWSAIHDLATGKREWPPKDHPDWGPFTLGKDNPHISTSGLLSAVATFATGANVASDLTPEEVRSQPVLDYVRAVEARAVHYGPTVINFFHEFRDADARGRSLNYVSAVAGAEEKIVWDYNQGNPDGLLGPDNPRKKPSVPMVAIYPNDGTLASDHPFLVLGAPWVDGDKRAVAEDFRRFLLAGPRQQQFTEVGFRNAKGERGPNLDNDPNFQQKGDPKLIQLPGGQTLAAITDSWEQVRKRARVLVVMDVSGSMQEAATPGGASKLQLAKDAAKNAIKQLAKDDQLGLWEFSSEIRGSPNPWRELVPVGPVDQVKAAFNQKVDALRAEGSTALYRTTSAAVGSVRDHLDDARINAVVLLSDGVNEDRDKDLNRVLAELSPEDLAQSVRVFTIAYGDKADKKTLQEIATASRATAYEASDPTTIDKVFTQVLSSF